MLFQGVAKPLEIAGGIMHVRFQHLHEMQANRRVHFDFAIIRLLDDDLLVHLAGRGHIDHDIPVQQRLTAEPAAILQRAAVLVFLLDLVKRRERPFLADHPMFGEFANGDIHLAAPADTAPAAHTVDINAENTGGLQHGRAIRKTPPFAGWHEGDQMRLFLFQEPVRHCACDGGRHGALHHCPRRQVHGKS